MPFVLRQLIQIISLLLLLLLSPLLWADGELHLQINKSTLELGKRLNVDLFAVGSKADLKKIDLKPLHTLFAMETPDDPERIADDRWPFDEVQRLRLRLYPRQLGKLTIPSLKLGKLHSKPQPIEVIKGMVKGEAIDFNFTLSNQNPWQRQQVILWVEVTTPQPFANLSISTNWKPRGIEVIPLPLVKRPPDNGKSSVLGIGWILFPLVPGEHRLDLPQIAYQLSGATKRRYYLPHPLIKVKALPPYVPPTMPVGKINLTGRIQPSGNLPQSSLAYWNLELQSDNLMPRWLPPIRDQIQSNQAIRFLPEDIDRTVKPDKQGVHGKVKLQMPFKPLESGRLALPELRIDYFDPQDGLLKRLRHKPDRPWTYDPRLLRLGIIILLLALGWTAWRMTPLLKDRWQRMIARRRLLQQMASVKEPYLMRIQLKQLAELDGWPCNISLQQWGGYWKNRYRTDGIFDELLNQLSHACYDNRHDLSFGHIREGLIKQIRERKWKTIIKFANGMVDCKT